MELSPCMQVLVAQLTTFGLKVLGAIAVWIVGRRLIAFAVRLTERALRRGTMDETLVGYVGSGLTILLDVVLVVAILGFFGVETTTFAALLAGPGLAPRTARGGLLPHVAPRRVLIAPPPPPPPDLRPPA